MNQHLIAVPGPSEEAFTCSCRHYEGNPCYLQFSAEEVLKARLEFMELTKQEMDIAVTSHLSSCMHRDMTTTRSKKRIQSERKNTRTDYLFGGHQVCREFFLHVHGISVKVLKNILVHFKKSGVCARRHKLSGTLPHNALSFEEIKQVVYFISNFAEANAIILPGRQPYGWKTDCKLLPTNCTKKHVFDLYSNEINRINSQSPHGTSSQPLRAVKYSTFVNLWNRFLPFITNLKPATDLCWYCQQRSVHMQRSVNLPTDKKSKAAKEMLDHLEDAAKERSLYNAVIQEVKVNLPDGIYLGPHEECSFQGTVHYSFDFAQQVHYPSNPQQPGPIFFKTPRKCGLFGVSCEGLTKQVNFLLDESWDYGKGANTVISLLHFFFDNFGLGETEVHLHADNCCGQNKSNAMIQYLLWRVLTGRHKKVTLSFLLAGHTKFACDWGFGLIKCKFRKTVVNCLKDIGDVVESSSVVNMSQLCASQDGTGIVPVYDWTNFLNTFCYRLPNILSYHHFYFEQGSGSVRVQELISSGDPVPIKIVKPNTQLPTKELPRQLQTKGLSNDRKWYLYKEIRPFVSPQHQDDVAPLPPASEPESSAVEEPTAKVSRLEPIRGKGKNAKAPSGAKGKGRGKKSK